MTDEELLARHAHCDSKLCRVEAPASEWATLANECTRALKLRDGAESPDDVPQAESGGATQDAATIIRDNRDALAAEWVRVTTAYPPPTDEDDPMYEASLSEWVLCLLGMYERGRVHLLTIKTDVVNLGVLEAAKPALTKEQFSALCGLVYLDNFHRINGHDVRWMREISERMKKKGYDAKSTPDRKD